MHPRGSQQVHPAFAGFLAQGIATVDVLQSHAVVAENQHLIRPEFGDDSQTNIQKGRHAVVEKVMGAQTYIPNSIQMAEDTSIQQITGPNMRRKSTYMRHPAMTACMAQMGSYVPAESAYLPIFDAIFTASERQMTWFQVNQPFYGDDGG